MRFITWLIIIWSALLIIFVPIVLASGETVVMIFWVVGFLVLSVIWTMTKLNDFTYTWLLYKQRETGIRPEELLEEDTQMQNTE